MCITGSFPCCKSSQAAHPLTCILVVLLKLKNCIALFHLLIHIKLILIAYNTTTGTCQLYNIVQFMMNHCGSPVKDHIYCVTICFDALLLSINLHVTALLLGFQRILLMKIRFHFPVTYSPVSKCCNSCSGKIGFEVCGFVFLFFCFVAHIHIHCCKTGAGHFWVLLLK